MAVVIDKGLKHVLGFLNLSSRKAPSKSVRGNMMEKLASRSQKRGLSWRYLSRQTRSDLNVLVA